MKRICFTFILTLTVLLSVVIFTDTNLSLPENVISASASDEGWPMFGHDQQNTRASSSEAPDTAFVFWSYKTGDSIHTSPIVTPYYHVCVTSTDGYLYCFNGVDGSLRWKQEIGPGVSSPAAGSYVVVVGSKDGYLHCFSTIFDGELIWSTYIGDDVGTPTISGDKIFVGTTGLQQYGSSEFMPNYIHALDLSTGNIDWIHEIEGSTNPGTIAAPAVDADKVFIGAYGNDDASGAVSCFDVSIGSFVWRKGVIGWVTSSPVIMDDRVFVATKQGYVYCLNKFSGNIIWQRDLGDLHIGSSLAFAAGKVFVGTDDGNVYCLHASQGDILWSYQTEDQIWSSPAIADGKVFIGSMDGSLYCLNMLDGSLMWRYKTGSYVSSSPVISGGRVFIGSGDDYVYCFGTFSIIIPVYQWPTAYIDSVSPTPANEGETVSFRGHGSDPDGSVVAYEWGSSIDGQLSTLAEFGIHSLSVGTHAIFFRVKDNHKIWSAEATMTLTITETPNLTPKASFTFSPDSPEVDQNVEFTDQSEDPEGETLLYSWDFGDETGSTEQNPNHQYRQVRSYTVILTVTDDKGATDTFSIPITVTEKSLCLIATATYGSELSPQVQFLRGFRDNTVYSTFAGSNFMTVFNEFYYSFSPSVASVIADTSVLRDIMKVILYPLIGILQVSSTVFSVFSINSELAIVLSGLVASTLIGLVYLTPLLILVLRSKRIDRYVSKIIKLLSTILVSSLVLIFSAEIVSSGILMMFATGTLVLGTLSLSALGSSQYIIKRLESRCPQV